MRYEDWDVLLFPSGTDAKVPLKEFKVACHVAPEIELSHIHGTAGMPVMTCFVPGLQPGTPFNISIHSWDVPEVSQFTQSYSKHTELVMFEARIIIDGRMVASKAFGRENEWPLQVKNTFDMTKRGEPEWLRFPRFREELLYQNHWSPGDDLGRIKVIISEGFPRDSLSVPIERVKNVVAFSFQHAPLDLLESNGIAWPNPFMWRRISPAISMPMPPYCSPDCVETHAHTFRRHSTHSKASCPTPAMAGFLPPQAPGVFTNTAFQIPYISRSDTLGSSLSHLDSDSSAYFEWLTSVGLQAEGRNMVPNNHQYSGRQSNSDASMPDYVGTRPEPEAMALSGASLEEDPMRLKVPTNTPTTRENTQACDFAMSTHTSTIPLDLATSLTHSLLNQPLPIPVFPQSAPLPAPEIRSRKENKHIAIASSNRSSVNSTPHTQQPETRKVSAPTFTMGHLMEISSASGRVNSGSTSPSSSSQAVFSANVSRTPSAGEFGADITNLSSTALPLATENQSVAFNMASTSGLKRSRAFTPASAKAIDAEDEPRRLSPHLRTSRQQESQVEQ